MESPRSYFASVTFGSKVLAIGGDDDQFLSDVEAYDEQKSQVQSKMRTGRYEHAAVVAEMPFRHLLRDKDEWGRQKMKMHHYMMRFEGFNENT